MANSVGRPPKYRSVDELQRRIDLYFEACDNHCTVYTDNEGKEIRTPAPKPYTTTGLALALDLTRQGLIEYQGKKEYSDTIKRAKLKVENYAEERLFSNGNCTGVIFNLKNNYGWKDKSEQDVNMQTEIKVIPPTMDVDAE